MGYAFEAGETVSEAVHRIADEQVERAVSTLAEATEPDYETAVHDCRKRAKKLRGLIRLVRPALGGAYAPANELFRDAARELSAARDAHAAVATFDHLVAASADQLPEDGLGPVRSGLAAQAEAASDAEGQRTRAESATELFRAGRAQVAYGQLASPDSNHPTPGRRSRETWPH